MTPPGRFKKDPAYPTVFGSTGALFNMTGLWFDNLKVTGTPGTQVQLQFTYHLDSTVGGTPGVPSQAI